MQAHYDDNFGARKLLIKLLGRRWGRLLHDCLRADMALICAFLGAWILFNDSQSIIFLSGVPRFFYGIGFTVSAALSWWAIRLWHACKPRRAAKTWVVAHVLACSTLFAYWLRWLIIYFSKQIYINIDSITGVKLSVGSAINGTLLADSIDFFIKSNNIEQLIVLGGTGTTAVAVYLPLALVAFRIASGVPPFDLHAKLKSNDKKDL